MATTPDQPTRRPDHPRRHDEVYSITSASEGHSDELGAREVRYAVSMILRTLCFVGGVVVWPYSTVAGVILFFFAIFLPYTSVILANAGVRSQGEGKDFLHPEPYGALDAGRDTDPDERRE